MEAPKQIRCRSRFEREGWRGGYRSIAGVDEVGVGALFGPVMAAAVILDPARPIRGIRDSKMLEPDVREKLATKIRASAIAWSLGSVDAGEIDRINIYQASRLAMRQAVIGLHLQPDLLLVDARRLDLEIHQHSIIKGDALSVSIAAASIVAKVARDELMRELDLVYPGYGLARHKGYSTPGHKKALQELGPTPLHRVSHAPVWAATARWNGIVTTQEVLDLVAVSESVCDSEAEAALRDFALSSLKAKTTDA